MGQEGLLLFPIPVASWKDLLGHCDVRCWTRRIFDLIQQCSPIILIAHGGSIPNCLPVERGAAVNEDH